MEILSFSQAEIQPRVVRFADLTATEDFVGATGDLSPAARSAVFSQQVYGLTSPTGPAVRLVWTLKTRPGLIGMSGASTCASSKVWPVLMSWVARSTLSGFM